jgi:hypothetical protein
VYKIQSAHSGVAENTSLLGCDAVTGCMLLNISKELSALTFKCPAIQEFSMSATIHLMTQHHIPADLNPLHQIYIYIFVCVCVCVREREREREFNTSIFNQIYN